MLDTIIIFTVWFVAAAALYFAFVRRSAGQIARDRMANSVGAEEQDEQSESESFLESWLVCAGFRAAGSASAFVLATILTTAIGAGIALLLSYSGVLEALRQRSAGVSALTDSLLGTALQVVPWAVFIFIATAPWVHVRSKRRKRVDSIERELPIVLELLATLSESGLGFDASFAKILDSERAETPLITEFRIFRTETLSGLPRIRCFRRLARRVEISSMTIFCSALIQAEQIGTGFSSVLRTQANDLRGRRRDRAMIKAQSLPVKLVFPLVICFLPGIFVVTLGPAFKEFFELAQGIMTGG